MLKEFKEFAMKGNVIDLAVGVVIGGAFGKIVTSLVNDIITPLLGLILGKVNVAGLAYKIPTTEIVIKYGVFLQNIVDFVIVAFSIFLFIKFINKFKKKEQTKETVKEEPKTSKEEQLLTEIRDLLKAQSNSLSQESQSTFPTQGAESNQ